MDDDSQRAMDVPGVAAVSVSPSSSPPTAAAAAAVDLYARRSCPRCGRRMSALKFDKHTFCVICRDVKCSLSTRCKECKAWSKDFMLGYVRHQRTLVTKGKRIPPSPSPSPPVTVVVTTSPDTSPTELFSEDRLRQLMQSMFRDLMPATICTNPSSTAPPAVPDSATKYTEATGRLQSVTPFEAPMMESPGVVLPTTQVDLPPPHTVSVSFVDSLGLSNLGGPIISCVGLPINVSRGTDQLRVVNVSSANVATVASVFSPGSLLFPFSDSGFASLSASSSSRPFALPLFLPLPPLVLLLCLLLLLLFPRLLLYLLPRFRRWLLPLSLLLFPFLLLFLLLPLSLLLFLLLPRFLLSWVLCLLLLRFLLPLPFRLQLLSFLLLDFLLFLLLLASLLFLLLFLLLFPLPPSRRLLPSLRFPLLFLLTVSPFRLGSLLRFFRLPPPLPPFLHWILLPIRLRC